MQLILPEELYEIIKNGFLSQHSRPKYSRVILPLEALLEGDFFNKYIKTGMLIRSPRYVSLEVGRYFLLPEHEKLWSHWETFYLDALGYLVTSP